MTDRRFDTLSETWDALFDVEGVLNAALKSPLLDADDKFLIRSAKTMVNRAMTRVANRNARYAFLSDGDDGT